MAEEQQELRSVNWGEVFSFTQIFKGFVMARDPGKLALSAMALILMFLCGWVMDVVWSSWGAYARVGEIAVFARARLGDNTPVRDFDQWLKDQDDKRLFDAAAFKADVLNDRHSLRTFRDNLTQLRPDSKEFDKALGKRLDDYNNTREKQFQDADAAKILKAAQDSKTSWSGLAKEAKAAFGEEVQKINEIVDGAATDAEADVKKLPEADGAKAKAALANSEHLAAEALSETKYSFLCTRVRAIRGDHISAGFIDYEWNCIQSALSAVTYGNITSGLKDYKLMMEARGVQPLAAPAVFVPPAPQDDPPGFLYFSLMAWRGVLWMVHTHWLYATIYLAMVLGVVALFGGAVNRIAALQFAREEKISMGQALKFSAGKFLSFFTAPLLPVLIILILGVLLGLGGLLLGNWLGGILLGVLFAVAIVLGLGVAFLLVGLGGGSALMYPTIAVEGSDSFDAISRSFSYVFARPWRAILYGLIALVYGTITYMFVRLFAYLALASTHYFLKWGVFANGNSLSPKACKLDVIWTAPTFDSLFGRFSWEAMSGWECIGAALIGIWVFLIATLVAAYLLSYAASASTIIYYLLRRAVDATDLDDVYVEEPLEKEPVIAVAAVATVETEAPPTTTTPPPEEEKKE